MTEATTPPSQVQTPVPNDLQALLQAPVKPVWWRRRLLWGTLLLIAACAGGYYAWQRAQ